MKEDITLKYQTTVDGDVEESSFSSGDEVELVQEWEASGHLTIKDDDGHYYTVAADKVDK